MKFLAIVVQKLLPEKTHRQTDTQMDRHTDTQTHRQTDPTEIITFPHTRMVKIRLGVAVPTSLIVLHETV